MPPATELATWEEVTLLCGTVDPGDQIRLILYNGRLCLTPRRLSESTSFFSFNFYCNSFWGTGGL